MILKNLFIRDKEKLNDRTSPKYRYILIYIICISIISLTFATGRIYVSDFNPINGDFQNYNAFRRLLDGQVPYKDFANYLGIGIFFTNIPILVFVNNFTASLFVTNFTTCFIFCVAVTTLLYICTNNKMISYIIGAISPLACEIISKNPIIGPMCDFSILYMPGNSMRMHRAFLPFLLVIVFIILKKLYFRIYREELDIFLLTKSKKCIAIIGFIIGLFMTWSNDFGFACFASSLVIILVVLAYINKKINLAYFYSVFIFMLTVIVGFLVSILLVTRGNIGSFIEFTLGVADYQFWYYGVSLGKILTVTDILNNKLYVKYIMVFVVITIICIVKMSKKTIRDFDILLYFIELSTFFASLIYIYGSGGYAFETFELTTFIISMSCFINVLLFILEKHKVKHLDINKICYIILVIFTAINSYWLLNKCLQLNNNRPVPYSDELKGYTKYAESLENTKKLIGDEKVFSTYATALELTLGQYQPSGTDYIIHVLGDKQREEYLNNFKENKYKYVTTTKPSFTDYESWIKRANWFFYREIYKNYVPISNSDYSTIWEKSNTISLNSSANISYSKIDDCTYEIVVVSDNKSDIIADVSLNYKSSYVSNLNRILTFKRVVCVEDSSMANENKTGWCNYNVPNESENYNIPIFLHNGEGKIKITSNPTNCTKLDIVHLKVNELLPNYYKEWDEKIILSKIIDENWNLGVKKDANVLLFENTKFNKEILMNAKQLKVQNVVKNINNIQYIDNQWIWVYLDDNENIEEFSYPNKIEVIK